LLSTTLTVILFVILRILAYFINVSAAPDYPMFKAGK